MKSKALLRCLIILSCIPFFSGCKDMVLEYKDVGLFKLTEEKIDNITYLIITGNSNYSSMNVANIDAIKQGNDLTIIVHVTVKRIKDGEINYRIKIDNNINRVLFGENRTIIWERKHD